MSEIFDPRGAPSRLDRRGPEAPEPVPPRALSPGSRSGLGATSRLDSTALFVYGAYLMLTLALTWPVVLDPSGPTLGMAIDDKWNHLWDFFWAGESLAVPGRAYFFCELIGWPPGTDLWGSNSGPLLYLLSLPVQHLWGDVHLTFNLVVLFSLWFSAVAGFHLGCRLLSDRRAAFVVGLLAAFNPLSLYWVLLDLYEFVNLGFALLYFSALITLMERRDLPSALRALSLYALTAFWSWYMGYLMLLFTLGTLLLGLDLRELLSRRRRDLRILVPFGLLLLVPLGTLHVMARMGPVEKDLRRVQDEMTARLDGRVTDIHAAPAHVMDDLAREVGEAPDPMLETLRLKVLTSTDIPRSLRDDPEDHVQGATFALNWIPILLLGGAALLLARRSRLVVQSLPLIAAGFLLSLGPCLVWNGHVFWGSARFMPYSLLQDLVPGLARVQFPRRFLVLCLVAGLPLAGLGLQALLRLGPWGRRRELVVVGLASLLSITAGLEITTFPMIRASIDIPDFYQKLGTEPAGAAVIDVPLTLNPGALSPPEESRYAYYQIAHRRPRLGSQVPHFLKNRNQSEIYNKTIHNMLLTYIESIVQSADTGSAAPRPDRDLRPALEALRQIGFGHLVLHSRHLAPGVLPRLRRLLDPLAGPPRSDRSSPEDPLVIYSFAPGVRARSPAIRPTEN